MIPETLTRKKHWNSRMKKSINILFILVFVCLSCGKAGLDADLNQEGVRLNISESILSVETKGPILPGQIGGENQFPVKSSYGLFICDHVSEGSNPYNEHAPEYNNIKVHNPNNANKWLFSYDEDDKSGFPVLFLVGKKDDADNSVCADIFAYAPYNKDVTTPEYIEFAISTQSDVMYAIQNSDPDVNKNINPLGEASEVDVPLTFAHALTLLEFNVELKNDKYNHPEGNGNVKGYIIEKIKVTKNAAADVPLYSGGTLNAINGELTPKDDVESMTVKCKYDVKNNKIKTYLLLVPTEPDDDEYIFSFYLNDVLLNSVFELKKEHLRHGDSDVYGFKPGYKYTFNFVIDNYIHFTGVEFGEWTTVQEPIYKIEI